MSNSKAPKSGGYLAVLGGVPALTLILLFYTGIGALIIMQIENRHVPPQNRGLTPDKVDANFLFELYAIRTSKLVSREKFAETAMKEMAKWQTIKAHLEWNFNSAFLYCFTLHTTIGYGHVAAHSTAGKWFSVIYAMIGIPLCLVYIGRLSLLAERQAANLLRAHPGLATTRPGRWLLPDADWWRPNANAGLPLGATAALFAGYCVLGGCIFAITEHWGPLDGAYFAVISATSIGLGDLVPGHAGLAQTVWAVLYLALGIALCTLLLNHLNERLCGAFSEPASAKSAAASSVHADFSYDGENSKER